MLPQNLHKIQNHFKDFDSFSLPAVKSNVQISRGRPSGGLTFLYDKKLSNGIERIVCPNSNRIQGLKVKLHNVSYVLINSYFPVDKRNNDIDELIKVLQDIKYILDTCNDHCKVILLGDLNCDFSRDTVFVNHIKQFLLENNLQTVWSKFMCDFSYSHTKLQNGINNTYNSTIDHFCVSNDLLNDCIEALPIHSPDNLSNHAPILLKFNCLGNINVDPSSDSIVNVSSKPIWERATESDLDNFKNNLEFLVNNIDVPVDALDCADVHCTCDEHKNVIDVYATNLMQAVSCAVENNIPHTNPNSARHAPVAGWNDFVKPFREDSIFWHSVWISAGRPQNTVLHNVMKNTRKKYHYAIHLVKKEESEIRKNNFVQKCFDGKINDILKHIKSSRKNKTGLVNKVDGVSGPENIASHFKNIFEGIYNQHESKDKVNDILFDLNSKIKTQDGLELNKISETLILNIISKLHSGKSDSVHNWSTDALKVGDTVLAGHFCKLFRAFFTHGYISDLFLDCSLIPIVKDQKVVKITLIIIALLQFPRYF